MFSIITIASSTTKPVEMVSAINERLSRLNPARYMMPKVPMSDSGNATLVITVVQSFRRKRNITMTTSAIVRSNVNCTSLNGGADRFGAIGQHFDMDRRR